MRDVGLSVALCVAYGCGKGANDDGGSNTATGGSEVSSGGQTDEDTGGTGASGGSHNGGSHAQSGGKGGGKGGGFGNGGQAGSGQTDVGGSGASVGSGGTDSGTGDSSPQSPAVGRGADYFGFSERFNRYYTDRKYQAKQVVFVSPSGAGSGMTPSAPAAVGDALSRVSPGTMVHFLPGNYTGCYELGAEQSGTYDDPVILYGERNEDGSLGAVLDCCDSGRQTCINLEAADYVAVDGFELRGGVYGVRSVSASYAAEDHQVGAAVLHSEAHGQDRDPFFTGGADWFVIEDVFAHDVGTADGHGIYLSNGSDYNIVRYNETTLTNSSDFQINADPLSTCIDEGVDAFSVECAGLAGSAPNAGAGASDYFLVEGNFFHHSGAQGANFTSVRHSQITNNIFAFALRHGVSFWQETENPDLGAHDNFVAHNLFMTSSGSHAVQMINSSTANEFRNNIVVAVTGDPLGGDAEGVLLETDSTTVDSIVFSDNFWLSGRFGSADSGGSYDPVATDQRLETLEPTWFADLRLAGAGDPNLYRGTATAPWRDAVPRLEQVLSDREGVARQEPADAGPFED